MEDEEEFPNVITGLSIMSYHSTRAEALIPCDFMLARGKNYREILIIH